MTSKTILRCKTTTKQREGGGFMVRRPIGSNIIDEDPILMLDHLGPVDYAPGEAVGAPDHPHRGFETVTYLIDGQTYHQDSVGNCGTLSAGWCQWMTAGSGVVHSEMPSAEFLKTGGRVEGFQLWVNLPKKYKMVSPRYQDTPPERIPVVRSPDGMTTIKILSGECLGTSAAIETRIPILFFDIHVAKGGKFDVAIPSNYNSFVYTWKGSGCVGTERTLVNDGKVVVLSQEGTFFTLEASSDNDLDVLVIGGEPIKEPVVRKGPFVMNTHEEIQQAFEDYRSGKLGEISGSEERYAQTRSAVQKSKQSGRYDQQ